MINWARTYCRAQFCSTGLEGIVLSVENAAISLNPKKTATRRRDKTLRNRALSTYGMTFFPFTSSDLVYPGNPPFNRLYLQAHIRINVVEDLRIKVSLNPKKTATRRRDKTLRNRALSTYGMTFFPFTSSDLVYPGNPPFNRLYLQAHIRINVPKDLRIKVSPRRDTNRNFCCNGAFVRLWQLSSATDSSFLS